LPKVLAQQRKLSGHVTSNMIAGIAQSV